MAFKRLVVLSDGTWQSLENPTPTNIQLLTLSIAAEDDEGVQQILVYDEGVGTDDENPLDKLLGGALGKGLDRNIEQLYRFLALNYDEGDEIYMFGFSRGAYTVRSLSGLIHTAGLTRRAQVNWAHEAYELYRKHVKPESDEAVAFRAAHGERVPVKLLACFDTVGSLGLPFTGPLFNRKRYEFHDTTLCCSVDNAIHMLSIDEDRKSFEPTLMEGNPEVEGQLSQKYFWGGHGGIGGGDSRQAEPPKATMGYLLDEMDARGLGLKVHRDTLPSDYDGECAVPQIDSGLDALIRNVTGRKVREIQSVEELHPTAVARFLARPEWRPDALKKVAPLLIAEAEKPAGEDVYVAEGDAVSREVVPEAAVEEEAVAEEAAEEEAAEEQAAEEEVAEEVAEEEAAEEEAAEEEAAEEEAAEEEAAEEEAAEEEAAEEEAAEEEPAEEEAAEEEAAEEEAAEEEAAEEEPAEEEPAEEEAAEEEAAEEPAEEEAAEEEAAEEEPAEEEAAEEEPAEEEAGEEEAAEEEGEAPAEGEEGGEGVPPAEEPAAA